jgi:hypothetical protein
VSRPWTLRGVEEEKLVAVAVEGQEAEYIEAAPGLEVAEHTGAGGMQEVVRTEQAVDLAAVAAGQVAGQVAGRLVEAP